jgi:hypothetical protein
LSRLGQGVNCRGNQLPVREEPVSSEHCTKISVAIAKWRAQYPAGIDEFIRDDIRITNELANPERLFDDPNDIM